MRSQNKKKSDMEKLREGGLRLWHIIAIVILFIIMLWAVVFSYNNRKGVGTELIYKAYDNDLILNGAFVEHVNVGGLTKEQAVKKVNEQYVYPVTKCVLTFIDMSDSYKKDYTAEELGLSYDVKDTVDKAYKLGRSGNKLERIAAATELGNRREFLALGFDVDKGRIKAAVNEMDSELSKMDIKMDKDRLEGMLYDMLQRMTVTEDNEDQVVYIPEKS